MLLTFDIQRTWWWSGTCFQLYSSPLTFLSKNGERCHNYQSESTPQHISPCAVCLRYPPHQCLGSIGCLTSLLTCVHFCLISGDASWKTSPLRKLQKSCFLYCKALFSSYISHKYNLSLITAWPWQDLESQNLIMFLDLQGYPVEPNRGNFSPTFLTNGHAAFACISAVTGSSITHEAANPTVGWHWEHLIFSQYMPPSNSNAGSRIERHTKGWGPLFTFSR